MFVTVSLISRWTRRRAFLKLLLCPLLYDIQQLHFVVVFGSSLTFACCSTLLHVAACCCLLVHFALVSSFCCILLYFCRWFVAMPYTTVYINPPPGRCPCSRYLHSWNSVGAKKVGVGNTQLRAFRRDVIQYWHPRGCRAIEFGKPSQGGVIHTVRRIYEFCGIFCIFFAFYVLHFFFRRCCASYSTNAFCWCLGLV